MQPPSSTAKHKSQLIWSSLRAEYAQTMFREHKVKEERKDIYCLLVYELVEGWSPVCLSLCLCAKRIHECTSQKNEVQWRRLPPLPSTFRDACTQRSPLCTAGNFCAGMSSLPRASWWSISFQLLPQHAACYLFYLEVKGGFPLWL